MQNSTPDKFIEEDTDFVELIRLAKTGDSDAFEQLYNTYFTKLYRYVLLRVGSQDDADDLVQTVFLKFYKNLDNWQDKGFAPSAYLYSIARSVIADHFRSNGRRGTKIADSEEILHLVADASQNVHQSVINIEEVAQLYRTIRVLPQNYQEVLLLRYSDNLASLEIAKIIGKTDAATRKLLSRATAALAVEMKNETKSEKNNE